jgi:hypothetical protein
MATTANDDGTMREIDERYVAVTQFTEYGKTSNYISVMIRDDDEAERSWLRERGYESTPGHRAAPWLRKATRRADLGAEMAVLLARGYHVPGGRRFEGEQRDFTREALSAALGRPAARADFVFPNPLFS